MDKNITLGRLITVFGFFFIIPGLVSMFYSLAMILTTANNDYLGLLMAYGCIFLVGCAVSRYGYDKLKADKHLFSM